MQKTIDQLVEELYQAADTHLFDPMKEMKPPHQRHRRDFQYQGLPLRVQFTRTLLGSTVIYQLSIGSYRGHRNIPEDVIERIRNAFFRQRESCELPSSLGNCRQFIAEV